MIRIHRLAPPPRLTNSAVASLTAIFKSTKKPVWNKAYIRKRLSEMSHGKCAYCETKIDEESKFLEVEHFFCKAIHDDLVVEWSNLLPACKRCNVAKSDHDVCVSPIVNPSMDDPRVHLYFDAYRVRAKTAAGRSTIDVLNLNDRMRLVRSRFDIGETINDAIVEIVALLESFPAGGVDSKKKNRIQEKLRVLLGEAQPNSSYSATAATSLILHPDYQGIRHDLESRGWLDDEILDLEKSAIASVLLPPPAPSAALLASVSNP
jgi:uncharacterized protein (TIGR02646 family)